MAVEKPVLLVGSIPGEDAASVFRACGPALGDRVAAIPDGETGKRRIWVVFIAATVLDPHPHVHALNRPRPVGSIENEWRTEAEDFVPSAFDDMWAFSVDDGVDAIEIETLGYAAHALASYEDFRAARAAGHIAEGVRFQVCLPLAESALRWFMADRRSYDIAKPAYEAALKRDLQTIVEAIPPADLSIQWDVCMEILAADLDDYTGEPPLAYRLPGTPVERWLEALADVSPMIPGEALLGLHLCYGDLGHVHMLEPRDLARSVEMSNLGCAKAGRRVDFVHMAVPRDRTDDAYFAPLAALDIGDAAPYLGLVHHTDGESGTRARIAAAKKVLGEFGIATECGFGRRPPEQIPALLEIHCKVLDAL